MIATRLWLGCILNLLALALTLRVSPLVAKALEVGSQQRSPFVSVTRVRTLCVISI
jgi:hypothetical protein